jgi:hypothetical protein
MVRCIVRDMFVNIIILRVICLETSDLCAKKKHVVRKNPRKKNPRKFEGITATTNPCGARGCLHGQGVTIGPEVG